jgi:hypothetical protein
MAEQQAAITQSPATAPASNAAMTPEAAAERIAELNADKDWGAKFLAGDLAVSRERDLLYQIAHGTEETRNRAIGEMSSRQSAITTPEQAKSRIEELKTDEAWRTKYLAGDRAAKKELDRLEAIAVGVDPDSALAKGAKALTPEQARLAALNEVPAAPEGYENLPFRHDDLPTPEGRTEIQGLMHTVGLTRSEGQTMISFAANDVAKWTQMDDAQRELHIADSLGRFNKMHGDQAPAMLDGARKLVAEITAKDGGRLREILEVTGAGASLAVINALAHAAKRRYRA